MDFLLRRRRIEIEQGLYASAHDGLPVAVRSLSVTALMRGAQSWAFLHSLAKRCWRKPTDAQREPLRSFTLIPLPEFDNQSGATASRGAAAAARKALADDLAHGRVQGRFVPLAVGVLELDRREI